MTLENGEKKGRLIVVGTGIRMVGQLTLEAIAWMRQADTLLYLVGDSAAEETVRSLNPAGAESLFGFYSEGLARRQTYERIIERTLDCVRAGALTCLAVYGHPGVFAYPTHESVRRARALGFSARMLPGISAEDCLFADLGIDPATHGCQSYEATDFLMNSRRVDPSASLVLWQIGVVGDPTFQRWGYDLSALPSLVMRLCLDYPPGHVVCVYEAAVYPGCEPSIRPVPLGALPSTPLSPMSTLYIPPARPPVPDVTFGRQFLARFLAAEARSG
jgi:hypothetical protein